MTKTIPADLRKAAKTMSRERGIPHQSALDLLAREAGHAGWGALLASKHPVIDPFSRLVLELREAGGTDLHLDPVSPMTHSQRHILLQQLSTMLIARVEASAALKTLREYHGGRIADAISGIETRMASGRSLIDAMMDDVSNFSGDTALILSDSEGGTANALRRAARHHETMPEQLPASARNQPVRCGARILFRIHGRRHLIRTLDPDAFDAMRTAIRKFLPDMSNKLPAEGSIDLVIDGMRRSYPVSSIPSDGDAKIVVRIPDRHIEALTLDQIGIEDLDGWLRICRSGPGIVIVSGKTGTGKSTTIAKTIALLRSEGIQAVAEEENGPYHENRVAAMVEAARTHTVLLEAYGSSLDRAMAGAIGFGLDKGDLARLFRGGIHQKLEHSAEGPRRLDATVLSRG